MEGPDRNHEQGTSRHARLIISIRQCENVSLRSEIFRNKPPQCPAHALFTEGPEQKNAHCTSTVKKSDPERAPQPEKQHRVEDGGVGYSRFIQPSSEMR